MSTVNESELQQAQQGWDAFRSRAAGAWQFLARGEGRWLALGLILFAGLYYLPVGVPRFDNAVQESLGLTRWYAREHVLLCLVPAFFIAGAISVFVSQAAVMKYLGSSANKVLAYGVAAVSGTLLAVCSCTVLPIFAGIHRRGAGLGPATAFLYSGPAINALAIILTARVLGVELGIARAVGAILFSVVIGLLMHLIFRRDEARRSAEGFVLPDEEQGRPLWKTAVFFAAMTGVLVFANWGRPGDATGFWVTVFEWKWQITAAFGLLLAYVLVAWMKQRAWLVITTAAATTLAALAFPAYAELAFVVGVAGLALSLALTPDAEGREWLRSSWGFAKQILPLLLAGVIVAGLLLGRPGNEGLIPSAWVEQALGGNSLGANLFASVAGALMYFATLTEVPILEGLLDAGMGDGPALALLLAGPALSLPNMLVIRSVMGTKKTLAYIVLVVIMATISGLVFGALMS